MEIAHDPQVEHPTDSFALRRCRCRGHPPVDWLIAAALMPELPVAGHLLRKRRRVGPLVREKMVRTLPVPLPFPLAAHPGTRLIPQHLADVSRSLGWSHGAVAFCDERQRNVSTTSSLICRRTRNVLLPGTVLALTVASISDRLDGHRLKTCVCHRTEIKKNSDTGKRQVLSLY